MRKREVRKGAEYEQSRLFFKSIYSCLRTGGDHYVGERVAVGSVARHVVTERWQFGIIRSPGSFGPQITIEFYLMFQKGSSFVLRRLYRPRHCLFGGRRTPTSQASPETETPVGWATLKVTAPKDFSDQWSTAGQPHLDGLKGRDKFDKGMQLSCSSKSRLILEGRLRLHADGDADSGPAGHVRSHTDSIRCATEWSRARNGDFVDPRGPLKLRSKRLQVDTSKATKCSIR
jgi:hypothetical protein